ncbi:hypothetical protein TYRP_023752, partial [Tyrophagus putrescentiae]
MSGYKRKKFVIPSSSEDEGEEEQQPKNAATPAKQKKEVLTKKRKSRVVSSEDDSDEVILSDYDKKPAKKARKLMNAEKGGSGGGKKASTSKTPSTQKNTLFNYFKPLNEMKASACVADNNNNTPSKSGCCKAGKGLNKKGSKSHRKAFRGYIQGITKPAFRRLARQGGVKRISGLIYNDEAISDKPTTSTSFPASKPTSSNGKSNPTVIEQSKSLPVPKLLSTLKKSSSPAAKSKSVSTDEDAEMTKQTENRLKRIWPFLITCHLEKLNGSKSGIEPIMTRLRAEYLKAYPNFAKDNELLPQDRKLSVYYGDWFGPKRGLKVLSSAPLSD